MSQPQSSSPPKVPAPRREGRFAGANLRPSTTSARALTAIAPVSKPRPRPRRFTPVPQDLSSDPLLLEDMSALPDNYSFEIPKTIHRLRESNATSVALQLPEGLLLYATTIADILVRHAHLSSALVLGDVTYGACCVDDLSAEALGADFLVHYGHSCLIPVTQTVLPSLYVFVHVSFDQVHLHRALLETFSSSDRVALVSTVQFIEAAHETAEALSNDLPRLFVPQRRPLSRGEILGCTSPPLPETDALVYIGDGRFHLESVMIANPNLRALRYDPYGKRLTEERYAIEEMHTVRKTAIATAASSSRFAVVLGTLGRQGSPAILTRVTTALRSAGHTFIIVLLSELSPAKLARFEQTGIQAWVQIACPRLSIDWGESYKAPLLTPYELFVALGKVEWRDIYPMDYYARDGGEWTNYFKEDATESTTRPKHGPRPKRGPRPSPTSLPSTVV